MTDSPRAALSHSTLQRLLAAVGSVRAQDDTPADVPRHDWRHPHYFNEDQYNRLAAMMSQVAANIGTKLTHFFNSEMAVTPSAISQRFATALHDIGIDEACHSLTFGPGKDKPCGFLALPAKTALAWVRRLLGDCESDNNPSRPLSTLEESLLGDVVVGTIDAVLAPLRAHQDLRPGDRVIQGEPAVRFEPTQEICAITFAVTVGDSNETDEIVLVAPCSVLAPLVGKKPPAIHPISPEELARTLMEHVQQMPIQVTARLACAKLNFRELIELSPDDILLLDKSVHEPMDVLVGDQLVFRGQPARSRETRAVLVTESVGRPGQKPSRAATGK